MRGSDVPPRLRDLRVEEVLDDIERVLDEVGAERAFILLRTHPRVAAPTLGIWSTGDDYLTEAQMLDSRRFVDGGWRYERRLAGEHWIPLDQPERTVELILSHIG